MRYFLLLVGLSLISLTLQAEERQRVIHVSGVGQVQVVPDMARLTVDVFHVAKEAASAKDHVNKAVNEVLDAAQSAGVTKKDMSASDFRIQPEYKYDKNNGRQFVGIRLERRVSITLRDLDKLAMLADGVIAADVDYFSPPVLDYSKRAQAEKEALRSAVANARIKAEIIADEENDSLGEALDIREQGGNHPQQRRAVAFSASMSDPSMPSVVLPGTLDIVSRVNAIFLLQD